MSDGLSYLIVQIGLLLLLALAVGMAVGRWLIPRPGAGRPRAGVTAAGQMLSSEFRLVEVEAQKAQLESQRVALEEQLGQARRRLTELQAEVLRAEAEAEAAVGEKETELRRLRVEARLVSEQKDEEVRRLHAEARALADAKEAEMGRLESGAIAALESTMASHRGRYDDLEARWRAAGESVRSLEQQLEIERRRSAQLQAALAERDEHLATVTAQLAERRPGPDRERESGSTR